MDPEWYECGLSFVLHRVSSVYNLFHLVMFPVEPKTYKEKATLDLWALNHAKNKMIKNI